MTDRAMEEGWNGERGRSKRRLMDRRKMDGGNGEGLNRKRQTGQWEKEET
jgi:hypothetical protein